MDLYELALTFRLIFLLRRGAVYFGIGSVMGDVDYGQHV